MRRGACHMARNLVFPSARQRWLSLAPELSTVSRQLSNYLAYWLVATTTKNSNKRNKNNISNNNSKNNNNNNLYGGLSFGNKIKIQQQNVSQVFTGEEYARGNGTRVCNNICCCCQIGVTVCAVQWHVAAATPPTSQPLYMWHLVGHRR